MQAKEFEKHIGSLLYWQEHSNRYTFYRCGWLDAIYKDHLVIDGNFVHPRDLSNLTTERHPHWGEEQSE